MRFALSVRRSNRSAFLRCLALAAILTAALVTLMSSGVRPGAGRMERSSFRGGAGYWLLAKDGGVFAFGDAQYFGPNRNQGNDIAGMAATATGNGYWTADDDGDVFAYGDAVDYGSRPGPEIDNITGFAARPQGDGYWMVANDGSVYAFGAAAYAGSANTLRLSKPIIGMAATPSGAGYWLIGADGGVFAYGDAKFFGSTGAIKLNRPIVDFAPSPDGKGYRFIGSDGGVFAYGSAAFFGSTGAMRLNQAVVGFAGTASGNGYWLVGQDGGVFAFGDAPFYGSTGGIKLNASIVAIVATPKVKVAPVARDDARTVDEDSSVTVDVEANDTHALPAAVSVNSNPAHGTAAMSGTKVVYTPSANYNGPDSFTYKLTDTAGHSATAAVTITVASVNDLPTISDIANQTTNVSTAKGPITFTVGDVETTPGSLTMSGTSSSQTLVPNANIAFGGSGASRTVTITPAAGQTGTATITVTVTDGNSGTSSDQFVLTVNALPTISDIGNQTVNEDTATGALSFTVGDAETAVGSLTVSGTSSNTTLVPNSPSNIAFAGSGASRTVTVTPAANQFGTATITVTVSDGTGGTANDTFLLTVTSVNDLPTISDISDQTINEDAATGPLSFTVGDVETAAGSLTLSKNSSDTTLVPTANIVFGGSGADRTVTVTPAAGESGTATITVTVTDGNSGTNNDQFVLTVNAAPTITSILDLAVSENTATGALAFTVGDAETAAGVLTLTGSSSDQSVVADAGIVFGGSGAGRTVTVTPALNASGVADITVTVHDSDGGSALKTFTLTVAVHDQPVAQEDDVNLSGVLTTGIDVLVNDSGLLDTPLTVEIVAGSLLGSEATATVDGSDNTIHLLAYPDTDNDGLITFQYKVTDADGDFAVASVTVHLLL